VTQSYKLAEKVSKKWNRSKKTHPRGTYQRSQKCKATKEEPSICKNTAQRDSKILSVPGNDRTV
jgi:hypothetical protein